MIRRRLPRMWFRTGASLAFAASVALVPAAAPAVTAGVSVTGDRVGAATPPAAVNARANRPDVGLESMSPTVAVPDTDVTVRVRVRNGTRSTATPVVAVGAGARLENREEVAAHLTTPRPTHVLATTTGAPIAAGETATVTVVLPKDALDLPRPFGVLPLTITVEGVGRPATIPSFLPYQVVKEYVPLELGVALPVTADASPDLVTGDARARDAAWTSMLQTGSRLDHVLSLAQATGATLVVDPMTITPESPPGDGTPAGSPTTSTGTDTKDTDSDPRSAFRQRLLDTGSDVWVTPPADPDLSALAATGGIPGLPPAPTRIPGSRLAPVRVGWPAESASASVRHQIGQAAALDTLLMPESQADPDEEHTSAASRRDPAGHRVLVTDDRMSHYLTRTTRADAAAVAQLLLADSVTLLDESPGRARSTLLLPDRGVDPDPSAYAQVLRTLQAAPWITPTAPATMLDGPVDPEPIHDPDAPAPAPAPASPSPAGAHTAATQSPTAGPTPHSQASAAPPTTPLTGAGRSEILDTTRQAEGLRPAVGSNAIAPDLFPLLTSTSWRGRTDAWQKAHSALRRQLDQIRTGVQVVPSTINFFADKGALQITVVNNLDVEVHDVHLATTLAGRAPRLTIHDPDQPLRIRPHSRTTVRLDAQALAPGLVPVTASLRTGAGEALGEDATVAVRVQPTNGWVLLAGGGVVGLVFLFGLFRAIRAGERRVAAADLHGLDLR